MTSAFQWMDEFNKKPCIEYEFQNDLKSISGLVGTKGKNFERHEKVIHKNSTTSQF